MSIRFLLAFITAFSAPVFAVQDNVIAEANKLISRRDFSAAYQLLEPLEATRAEMAKAHFILGEIDASKAEFNNVLKQSPDAATKKTIEKLLNAIDKIEGTTTTFGAYVGGGLGTILT